MRTVLDIEDNQIDKLLFYTQAKTSAEVIAKIIQDYLFQKENTNHQISGNELIVPRRKIKL